MRLVFERAGRKTSPPWSLAIGCAIGLYFRPFSPLAVAIGGLALLLARVPLRAKGLKAWPAAPFAGLAAGALLAAYSAGFAAPPWPTASARADRGSGGLEIVGLSGLLAEDSRPARSGLRSMHLAVNEVRFAGPGMRGSYTTQGSARLLVRDGPPLAAGAMIEIGGRPGASSDAGGLFFGDRRDLLVRSEGRPSDKVRNFLHEAFLRSLARAMGEEARGEGPPRIGDETGLLLALLAGWQDELSDVDKAAFRGAGCTHILALSGQHLALVAGVVVLLLKPLFGPRRALVPALAFVALYVFVVGPGPSLLRALISFAVASVATWTDRPQDQRTLLGLTFAVHAITFPAQIGEAGFVLSYLAVAGLALLAPRLRYLFEPWLPPSLAGALAASVAAQLATSPWIAVTFGVFQPVGIVATLATALLVEAIMILGLAAIPLVAIVPAAAALTAPLETFLIRTLETAMRFFAALPSPVWPEGAPRIVVAVVIVLCAAFLYALPHVHPSPGAAAPSARL